MNIDDANEGETALVPTRRLRITVNAVERAIRIEDRQLLVDVLRETLGLTGPKIGCYNGDCGACTVMIDGTIAKSCLMLAASAEGSVVTTIEGVSAPGELDELQKALWENDAFQCGFCISGHLFALRQLLETNSDPTEQEIREALIGNLCRCTGYNSLVKAVLQIADGRRQAA